MTKIWSELKLTFGCDGCGALAPAVRGHLTAIPFRGSRCGQRGLDTRSLCQCFALMSALRQHPGGVAYCYVGLLNRNLMILTKTMCLNLSKVVYARCKLYNSNILSWAEIHAL